MIQPLEFYRAQVASFREELAVIKRKLRLSSLLRLFVFTGIIAGIYMAFGKTYVVLGILVVGITIFLFLVSRHTDIVYQRDLKRALLKRNELEIEVLQRNFHDLPSGDQFQNPLHEFSQDIDLFGRGSLFQYIHRTALESGANLLAILFTANDTQNIVEKQKAIQELAQLPKWRQLFSGIASLVQTQYSSKDTVKWLKDYASFTPFYTKILCYAFSIISLLLLVLSFFAIISGTIPVVWFFLGLGISGRYVKKVNDVSIGTSKLQGTFQQFYKLIAQIEQQDFQSELLQKQKAAVCSDTKKASSILQKFARHLSALDQRNNLIVGVFTNGFMLRDLLQVYYIEQWIEAHQENVAIWFDTIAFFDAFNSLGNYSFNHPNHVFPKITNNKNTLKVVQGGHPLLDPNISVLNDFTIQTEQFFIITGANMAGKSTFLRTVALQIVMANIGLPVCAKSAEYTPIKLITSMRTTDSLTDDESYFFSELKRLKYIVDTIKEDQYFIILDEILKGTNSTDKAIGSRKFVDKLVSSSSTGIIATHDLSLCKAADELPEVQNYYFDARIENDELFFDYTFKEGVCQNMNASFLLKKMNIVE